MTANTMMTGVNVLEASGKSVRQKRIIPNVPTLSRIPRRRTDVPGVADGADGSGIAGSTGGACTVILVVEPVCIASRVSSISVLYSFAVTFLLSTPNCLFNKFDINYSEFRNDLLPLEPRIGMSHTIVPGDHGRGFSGSCLPKETRGMKFLQESLSIPNSVLDEILKRNMQMRNEK